MIPRIGREIDSEQYWRERAGRYSGEIADAYHQHRLSVIKALYPPGGVKGLRCLEFGSGDGVVLSRLAESGADVIGIERSAELLQDSKHRLKGAQLFQGGVEALSQVASQSID